MDILKHIYETNEVELINYYSQNRSSQTELFLALSLYNVSKDESSMNTLKIIAQTYDNTDEIFKKRFAHLIRANIGLDVNFLNGLKNTNVFKIFLEEYHDNISDRLNFWSEKMKSGDENIQSPISLNDLNKIQKILSEISPSVNQQEMLDPTLPTSYFASKRISELKALNSNEDKKALEEDLLISAFTEFKIKKFPLTEIEKFINKTREIRNDFIKHSINDNDVISPLFACLHKDIISALTLPENLKKHLDSFNYNNLWNDITKYSTDNLFKSDFETIELPFELQSIYKETKVKQAIWVLTSDGEAVFGGRTTLNFTNKDEVHHTDLAKGKEVKSAGTILFSEDMTKIIAISPNSGHYRPNVESCLHMKNHMQQTNFDTNGLTICDINWNPKIIDVSETFKPRSSEKVSNAILSFREKLLNSNMSTNKVQIKFDK